MLGGIAVSNINPAIQEQFETLPMELKNAILSQNISLNNMNDLISALEQIVEDGQ